MPTMHPLAEQWMAGLADADLVVNRDDMVEEAGANLWWFGLTRDQAADVTVEDLAAFMAAVTDLRRAQVVRAGGPPMVLVWWHDLPTAQLRCTLVSAAHGMVPVGAEYRAAEAPEDVARDWLGSPLLSGLPLLDAGAMPAGEAVWEAAGPREAPGAPRVAWIVSLP